MFDYKEMILVLADLKKMSPKKRRKVMTSLLFDDDFIKWLFMPEKIPNLTQVVTEMYKLLCEPYALEALIETIEYEGESEFNRTHAVFFTTVCNIVIEYCNDNINHISKLKKNREITRDEVREKMEEIEEKSDLVVKLLKRIRRITKRDSKGLSRQAKLPRYITDAAYSSVPDPKYVDRYKIGFYLNTLLNTIYSDVEENGDFLKIPDWREFFGEIFGKSNIIECATFILLEGVHRLDKYSNSSDVRSCWDSLTDFALDALEHVPENSRVQMIELYIKRVSKMFTDKSFDLRVDLLDLDKGIFPKLAKTVSRYADKLMSLFRKGLAGE